MPFPKKKNPKLQEASKKGHLARWGGKRIKVEAEAKLPLPLLELPEELRALIFEAVGSILPHLRSDAPTPCLAATALQTLTCNRETTRCNRPYLSIP